MSRIRLSAAIALSVLVFAGAASAAATLTASAPPPEGEASRKARYTAYARASADWAWSHYDEIVALWKKSFDPNNVFGYRAPGGLLEMAAIYAHFSKSSGNPNTWTGPRKSS